MFFPKLSLYFFFRLLYNNFNYFYKSIFKVWFFTYKRKGAVKLDKIL